MTEVHMSEDQTPENTGSEAANEAPQSPDDIVKNIKAEFSRKTGNLEQRLAETNAQLEQMVRMVQEANKAAKPAVSNKELLFENPDEFISQIEQRASSRAEEKIAKQAEAQAAVQNAIVEIQSQFPEFAQPGSEATRLAVELSNKLPARLKGTPEGAELAMSKAAAQLGLVPVSRRQKSTPASEDFVAGSKSSGASKTSQSKTKVDDKTIAFAQLLGIDVNDKKRMEGLAKAQERTNWKSYK